MGRGIVPKIYVQTIVPKIYVQTAEEVERFFTSPGLPLGDEPCGKKRGAPIGKRSAS